MTHNQVSQSFQAAFGKHEFTVFAPGRANIIGEHTDYNDGFVLPFAIGQGVWFIAKRTTKTEMEVLACNTGEKTILRHDGGSTTDFGWQKFFRQVLEACNHLPLPGLQLAFGGNLPIGAGISSSSAITCGLIEILNLAGNWQMNVQEMIKTAVIAETGYGVRGGIMDQYTIFSGTKNEAILLDCQSNTHQSIPMLLDAYSFLLINTNVQHNLIDTDYNNRRAQCERAVTIIQKIYPAVQSLRDLPNAALASIRPLLDDLLYNRVSYVIEENQRVLQAVQAIQAQDFALLGELLNLSHQGLSVKYEVSCQELDWLADLSRNHPAFAGSRMMGGGFGGCTINLLRRPLQPEEEKQISMDYTRQFGFSPSFIPVSPEDGILARLGSAEQNV
jgi:galactokinase